jgi:hypothetical protein
MEWREEDAEAQVDVHPADPLLEAALDDILIREQLEDWIAPGQVHECLGRRARRHGKIAPYRELEPVQIGLQDLRLLAVGDGSKSKSPPRPPLPERNLSGDFRIEDPLCPTAAGDEEAPASELQQIDRRGVCPPRPASPDLQQVVVGQAETEPDQVRTPG